MDRNSNDNCGLSDAGTDSVSRFHFAVKIHFQRQRGSIEDRAAILAIAKMALDFSSHFRREPTFQIFADEADCRFASDTHGRSPGAELPIFMHAISQNMRLPSIFVTYL
jgi:hypothetical protein